MNRRTFLTRGTALAGFSLMPSSTILLTGCNTSWIVTAEKDIPTITTILDSLLAIVADATGNSTLEPAGQAILNKAITIAQASLATLESLIADYNAAPSASIITKIQAALNDVSTNLNGILSAVSIKDPALQSSISAGVNLAITVISAIALLLPATVAGKSTSTAPVAMLLTPEQLKQQFNTVITANGYSKHKV